MNIEASAREYCRLCGVDPDEEVLVRPDDFDPRLLVDRWTKKRRWETVVPLLLDLDRKLKALGYRPEVKP